MKTLMLWVMTACAVITLSACSSGPSYTKADPSLQASTAGNFDHILLPPGGTLPTFSRVYIETPEVTMNRQWLNNFRSQYTQSDLERIERDYGQLLKVSLTKGLTDNTNLQVVDTAEEADIIFRPKLHNLNIYAPDLIRGIRDSYYAHEAGNATLDLHLIDAKTNAVVGQFVDHRETRAGPLLRGQRANRATNARYFRRMMDRWSNNLAEHLIDTGVVSERG